MQARELSASPVADNRSMRVPSVAVISSKKLHRLRVGPISNASRYRQASISKGRYAEQILANPA